jgi:Xaa-Pro dipeptidase
MVIMNFTFEEYQNRLALVKNKMSQSGLEVLIVSDPSNMHWLTGYDGWSFYVHQGLIVALDQPEPIWWGRGMDGNGARITTYLSQADIKPYPDDYVQNPLKHPLEFAADILFERGLDKKTTGAELDNYWYSGKSQEALTKKLRKAPLDATGLVNWCRIIKSPREIEYIRCAAQVCRRVMSAAAAAIEPGRLEREAAAEVYKACILGTGEVSGDHPAIFPIMPTNERTSCAHLGWDLERIYAENDLVLLELCGVHRRYHCPLSRTVYLGNPPAKLRHVESAVLTGVERVIEFIKPGVLAWEVEERWREVTAPYGVIKPSRLGYSIGASYVPDWGERTISLRPGDSTVLQPGMTLHIMPGIWEDDLGFENSEPILVTEQGCEPLMDFPRGILR